MTRPARWVAAALLSAGLTLAGSARSEGSSTAEAAPAPPKAAAPAKLANGPKKPTWPTVLLGAVGAAGLGFAIVGFAVSVKRSADANAIAEELRGAGEHCVDRPERCKDGDAALGDRQIFEAIGVANLVLGAAAITAMAFYGLVPEPTATKAKTALRIEPAVWPITGLVVRGSYP